MMFLTQHDASELMCDKGIKKIRALARSYLYIPVTERKLLMNAYFLAEFGYCP